MDAIDGHSLFNLNQYIRSEGFFALNFRCHPSSFIRAKLRHNEHTLYTLMKMDRWYKQLQSEKNSTDRSYLNQITNAFVTTLKKANEQMKPKINLFDENKIKLFAATLSLFF